MTLKMKQAIEVCSVIANYGTAEAKKCFGSPQVEEAVYMACNALKALDGGQPLHKFLNAAAGEGIELEGIDAGELYVELFPELYAAQVASITERTKGGT